MRGDNQGETRLILIVALYRELNVLKAYLQSTVLV